MEKLHKLVNGIQVPLTEQEESEIRQEWANNQEEALAKAYIRERIKAYPPVTEQLDMIFHNGLDYWKEQIQTIKDTYPKPNTKE